MFEEFERSVTSGNLLVQNDGFTRVFSDFDDFWEFVQWLAERLNYE